MTDIAENEIQIPEDMIEVVSSGIDYYSAQDWIPWAWAALVRAGDAPPYVDEDDENYVHYLITLAALGHLFDRFHDIYTGARYEDDCEHGFELFGEYRAHITEIEIARYCERHGYHDNAHDPETADGLAFAAIFDQTIGVRLRLRELVGDGRLFTSLIHAGNSDRTGDFDDDDHDEDETAETADDSNASRLAVDRFDSCIVTSANSGATDYEMHAYAWLTGITAHR